MLQRAILHVMKVSGKMPKYSYAKKNKTEASKQPVKQEPPKQEPKSQPVKQEPSKQQPKSQPIRTSPRQEDQEDDVPLQKQNRNTIGWWIYRFFFWGGMSLLSYNVYLVYTHNKKTPVDQELGAVPIFVDAAKTIVNNINDMTEFITQPPSKKLLVDTVHPDFHPKTLVLNLTGTLVKSQYIFGKGNKIMLRPGLQNMLKKLVQKYEIIIFAEEDSPFIMNSINHIDPRHQYIQGIFGRQSMVWRGGHYIKDLKYLNRDPRKIVVIDHKLQNVKNHPENVILLPDYDGNKEDNQLVKLLLLLDHMAGPEVTDIRKFLKNYGEKPVDTFYDKLKERQKNLEKKTKSSVFGRFGNNTKQAHKQESDL